MWSRVKQVWAAVTATVDEQELAQVRTVLSPAEYVLFQGMSLPNQRHSLNVAATAAALAAARPGQVDTRLLHRAALLHDVGRRAPDMSTLDKIVAVLLDKCIPVQAQRWARYGRGSLIANLRHAVYVYYHHARLSAEALATAGTEDKLVDIVRAHHQTATVGDPTELVLLRQADDAN